jgi:NAD-dependent dihydropyrimidine dehydrogenase PreA subunit
MKLPVIDTPRCTGCGWCVAACPPHVLSLQADGFRKHSVLHDQAGCTGCSLCARRCPFGVITMVKPTPNTAQHPQE